MGDTNPCPESEVSIVSIEESASASTQYFQQTLLIFYFMCLALTGFWTTLTTKQFDTNASVLFNKVKRSLSSRK
ncbi:hypothetical protein [Vibrio parahaemolyticus]|uniref:hypothetical protein n=1 Tax=Vibrio parahaemolyticus TaxID=670 RepID=UPI0023599767|nr:hypothetical protein [Vibrio parahaemolyticus]WCZ04702.1 hypothetical protein GSS61_26740 [Vibrio parahaemolyticus]